MALRGDAAVAMWWRIAPEMRAEFEDWHSHEHFPERMRIPGFRRGSRWADCEGGDDFFVLYELDSYETLVSDAYLARLNDPTPWSTRMMPHHQDMIRSQCRVVASFGGGIARHMTTLRFCPQPEGVDDAWSGFRSALASLPDRPGIAAAHVLRTDTPAHEPTIEQRIRGGDAVAAWALLLSGYDPAAISDVSAELDPLLSRLASADGPTIVQSHYQLAYSLSHEDVGRTDPVP